jgi:hypothetical protein
LEIDEDFAWGARFAHFFMLLLHQYQAKEGVGSANKNRKKSRRVTTFLWHTPDFGNSAQCRYGEGHPLSVETRWKPHWSSKMHTVSTGSDKAEISCCTDG